MAIDLSHASVLVAGATGGLGSTIAARLADEGADLTLLTSRDEHLDRRPEGPTALALDLRLAQAALTAFDAALADDTKDLPASAFG